MPDLTRARIARDIETLVERVHPRPRGGDTMRVFELEQALVGYVEDIIREVGSQAAPLADLASWIVALDGHPLTVGRPTPGDMQAIIRRAREALDNKAS